MTGGWDAAILENSKDKYRDLEMKAQQICVVFRDQELPPAALPPLTRIGFEIAPSGVATIYIDKGVFLQGSTRTTRMAFKWD